MNHIYPRTDLTFTGGAGTVTGSKHWIRTPKGQLLFDCGLFQGLKQLRNRNWSRQPFDPKNLSAVVLSHAHLDHSGYLPVLARQGFRGPIHCTPGTADLAAVVLRDSAHIQEEDAERANRLGYSKHHPARPLYTREDVERTLELFCTASFNEPFEVLTDSRARFHRAGHILGSAIVDLELAGPDAVRVVFSGDLGRYGRPILHDPESIPHADVLLVESTYGDRTHARDPEEQLARVISETAHRGGVVIVPAFAIGRTQELIWAIRKLEDSGRIPSISVYVDSPMAIDVTEIYCRHPDDHGLDMRLLMDEQRCPLCSRQYHRVRTRQESMELNGRDGPMVIVAGSGMATGGRVLHHLKHRLSDRRNTVLLSGYQAAGTRGRALQEGVRSIRIQGQDIEVRAHIETIDGLSAHADGDELLRWMRGFRAPPAHTYVVHGEHDPAYALAARVRTELGWRISVAVDGATVPLSTTREVGK